MNNYRLSLHRSMRTIVFAMVVIFIGVSPSSAVASDVEIDEIIMLWHGAGYDDSNRLLTRFALQAESIELDELYEQGGVEALFDDILITIAGVDVTQFCTRTPLFLPNPIAIDERLPTAVYDCDVPAEACLHFHPATTLTLSLFDRAESEAVECLTCEITMLPAFISAILGHPFITD